MWEKLEDYNFVCLFVFHATSYCEIKQSITV